MKFPGYRVEKLVKLREGICPGWENDWREYVR